jgi:hypothetical protein
VRSRIARRNSSGLEKNEFSISTRPTNDWMRAEDVDSKIRVQQIGIVGTDHWIVIVRQNAVQPHLVFNPILAARPVFHGGFGVRHHAGQREAQCRPCLERLLNEREHGVLVEAPALEIGVLRQCTSSGLLRLFHIDPCVAQAPKMVLRVAGRQHMEGALAAIDAITDEGQQRVVFGVG